MKFFQFWIGTRIKERGWPKTQGLLRRRKVITEEVVIAATQDAIRIAITIGGSLPDVAKAIAITCMDTSGEPLTQKAVEKWMNRSATMASWLSMLAIALVRLLWFCITIVPFASITHKVQVMSDYS